MLAGRLQNQLLKVKNYHFFRAFNDFISKTFFLNVSTFGLKFIECCIPPLKTAQPLNIVNLDKSEKGEYFFASWYFNFL